MTSVTQLERPSDADGCYSPGPMPHGSIPPEYAGWWRIRETSAWGTKALDALGSSVDTKGASFAKQTITLKEGGN